MSHNLLVDLLPQLSDLNKRTSGVDSLLYKFLNDIKCIQSVPTVSMRWNSDQLLFLILFLLMLLKFVYFFVRSKVSFDSAVIQITIHTHKKKGVILSQEISAS